MSRIRVVADYPTSHHPLPNLRRLMHAFITLLKNGHPEFTPKPKRCQDSFLVFVDSDEGFLTFFSSALIPIYY